MASHDSSGITVREDNRWRLPAENHAQNGPGRDSAASRILKPTVSGSRMRVIAPVCGSASTRSSRSISTTYPNSDPPPGIAVIPVKNYVHGLHNHRRQQSQGKSLA